MKTSASSETYIQSTDKKRKALIKLEFKRFGPKGRKIENEFFWLNGYGAFTLGDLKKIAEEAEKLIKIADGAEATDLE